jgi:hypothetical protein
MIEAHLGELEATTSTSAACHLLGVLRATRYGGGDRQWRVRRHPGWHHRTP